MDLQYFAGNCVVLSNKEFRVVVDDNLAELGLKSVTRQGDIVLFTGVSAALKAEPRLVINGPGEYEVADVSIIGIAARAHMDERGMHNATMYKLMTDDTKYLFTGHVHPDLSDDLLESIGMIDVMFVPVGGNGYTLDATGALQLIKKIEPKLVVPTHYAEPGINYPVEQQPLDQVLKNVGMEPRETVAKLKFKPSELAATTELVILSRS